MVPATGQMNGQVEAEESGCPRPRSARKIRRRNEESREGTPTRWRNNKMSARRGSPDTDRNEPTGLRRPRSSGLLSPATGTDTGSAHHAWERTPNTVSPCAWYTRMPPFPCRTQNSVARHAPFPFAGPWPDAPPGGVAPQYKEGQRSSSRRMPSSASPRCASPVHPWPVKLPQKAVLLPAKYRRKSSLQE